MKPADAKAPKFDSRWWAANKAKDADPRGDFGKALKAYETAKQSFFTDAEKPKSGSSSPSISVQKALTAIQQEALKEQKNPKLGTFQKETKEALGNYAKRSELAIRECKAAEKSKYVMMDIPTLVKSSPQFHAYCKRTLIKENSDFLAAVVKGPRDGRMYAAFISKKAPVDINIKAATADKFHAIAKSIETDPANNPDTPQTWAQAPWNAAALEITEMLKRDVLPRFRFWAVGMLLKTPLP